MSASSSSQASDGVVDPPYEPTSPAREDEDEEKQPKKRKREEGKAVLNLTIYHALVKKLVGDSTGWTNAEVAEQDLAWGDIFENCADDYIFLSVVQGESTRRYFIKPKDMGHIALEALVCRSRRETASLAREYANDVNFALIERKGATPEACGVSKFAVVRVATLYV